MSKFNKKTLVASVLTALLMSGSAIAFDGTFNAVTPATGSTKGTADVRQNIATQIAQPYSLSSPVIVSTQVGDNIIGRTTGFQVRLTLKDGFLWDIAGNTTPTTLTVGPALQAGAPWIVTISPASDGTPFLVFSVQPQAGSSAIVAGDIGSIAGLYFNSPTPPADGALVDATLFAVDSNSSAVIGVEEMQLARFTDGLAVTCVATPESAAEFAKIDVKADGSIGDAAKTDFVLGSPWTIGTGTATTANLGAINFASSAGVTFNAASTFAINVTPQSRTGVVSFGASNTPNCAAQFGVDSVASVPGGVYNITFTGADAGIVAPATSNAETVYLCINVNGTSALAAQTFLVNTGVNGVTQPEACPVAPLNFNGSVVKVFNWNPSQNTRQESLVRIVNDGSVSGDVSIIGINDDGTQVGPVRFNLPRTNAVFLSAKDLETGVDDNTPGIAFTGSLGAATGKRRLEITGEFDRMIVQGYSRNGSTNTLSNTTDADTFEEQKAENKQ